MLRPTSLVLAVMKGAAALLGALGLLGSSVAHAAPDGTGRVSLLGGWRLTPNTYFAHQAELAGTPETSSSPGGPFVLGSFGYTIGSDIEAAVELFGGGERLHLRGQPPVTSVSYGGLLGVRYQPELSNGFSLSFGISSGPALVYLSGGKLDAPSEQFTQAYCGTAGVSWRFAPNTSLTLEYRLLLLRGFLPSISSVNGGGSWLGIGLTFWIPASESTREPRF